MQCSSCGAQLPEAAAFCPTCGTIAHSRVSESGLSPDELTSASSPYGAPEPKQATDYGSPPYGLNEQNPYEPYPYSLPHPYELSLPPPPPPPPPRRRIKTGLLLGIGVVVALLILTGIGVFAFLPKGAKTTSLTSASPSPATPNIAPATSTTTGETMPYPPYRGILVLSDPLHDNSKGNQWDEFPLTSAGAVCQFKGGSYHVSETQPSYFNTCFDQESNFSNFCFEVQMTIIKENGGGIVFRADSLQGSSYYFRVLLDGTYILDRFDGAGQAGQTLASGPSSAIKTSLNQSNLIAVIANGQTLVLYVNHQQLASVSDSTYKNGKIGVTADYAPAEVVYSNVRAWTV